MNNTDSIKIALAGNPNSGKTTLFNELTGSSQYVGNWPGVTVEKKEGKLRGIAPDADVTIVDLPGIYSLSPYTMEEVVTRNYLVTERPDVILNIVDASNLERNLYLSTQLLEIGIPMVIALNMIDMVKKNGDEIYAEELSKALGCPVVLTAAVNGSGAKDAALKAIEVVGSSSPAVILFSPPVEAAVQKIQAMLSGNEPAKKAPRWYAVKLFERDAKIQEQLALSDSVLAEIEAINAACEAEGDDDCESLITNDRYNAIGDIVVKCLKRKPRAMSTSDKIDRIVTNRWLALPIFAAMMFLVYYISVSSLGTIVTDWTNDVLFGTWVAGGVSAFLENVGAAVWLQSLIVDGLIGGVGAVLGFLPQMMILFFFLSILEDCGYMSRVAFIMDRIFHKFGLSGKSFIPILISSGCGVPGIMASRTIENEKDRRMTIMVTTFIPCGAKLPIIALIAAAFFPDSAWWVAPSIYFLGILMVVFSGIVLKKTRLFAGVPAPFVMELPQYHIPAPRGIVIHMWERGKAFVRKAGTVIFVACGVIWFLSNFAWNLSMVDAENSILADIGHAIAPVFAPLGFGEWQATVASLTGLVAKENVVGTLGVLAGSADAVESDPTLLDNMARLFTVVSAYAFMVFNMLCAPCFAAIGAIRREMGSFKWTLITIGYQTLLAYAMAFLINQLGNLLFMGGEFTVSSGLALLVLAGMLWLLFRPDRNQRQVKPQRT